MNELEAISAEALLNKDFGIRGDVLTGLLRERQLMMLYAETGIGKSWFAWTMACAVAGGGSFHEYASPQPRRVLFIDGEMDLEDIQERVSICQRIVGGSVTAIGSNLTIVPRQGQNFKSDFVDLNQPEWQEDVIEYARRHGYEFVILDNFSTLAAIEDENAAAQFNELTNFLVKLKQAGISGLLVHHSNKAKGSYRGSQKLSVTFDVIAKLTRPEDAPPGGCVIELSFDKMRTNGRREPVRLTLNEHEWLVDEADCALDHVLRMLKSGRYSTQKDLATAYGCSSGEMSKMRKRAVQQGKITEEGWKAALGKTNRANAAGFGDTSEF